MSSREGEASDSEYSHSTGSLLGEEGAPEARPASSLGSLGWGDSDDYSTDVSDNPRLMGRRVEQSVAAPHGALVEL